MKFPNNVRVNMINLMQGDCLERMKEIPNETVDMVLTEPPYGMSYVSNHRKVKFDAIANDDDLDWVDIFVDEIFRVLKQDTPAYIFCSWHHVDVFKRSVERKFKLKNVLVWVKNNHGAGDLKGAYAPKHEFVLYAHKGRCLLKNGRTTDVIFEDKVASTKMVHPTEKPVGLLKRFIEDGSDENDIILDPFMGSGTTGIAAKNMKRGFIGIEKETVYFNIAKERIEDTSHDIGTFFVG